MDRIPVVQVLKSGCEIVVAQGHDMAAAERLLLWLAERHPTRNYYIDCARTVAEVKRGSV
jgi:hypothetical protein